MEKNETPIPTPPPLASPQVPENQEAEGCFLRCHQLTIKISHAIVLPFSGELGTEVETLRPRPKWVSSPNHLNPFAAAVPLAAHLGSATVQS